MNDINLDFSQARDMIRPFEGLRLEAYQDIAGVWTIGYGHTSTVGAPEVTPGLKITKREAEQILMKDIEVFFTELKPLIKTELNANQWSAILSLVFNIGIGNFKTSTVLKRINSNDLKGAAEAITWWNKATIGGEKRVLKGLVRRREAERDLFLNADVYASAPESTDLRPGNVEADELKPLKESKTNALALGGTAVSLAGALSNINPVWIFAIIALVFGGILLNRYLDRKKGIH